MEDQVMSLVKFSNQLPSIFDRFFETDLFDWSNRHYSTTNTTLPSVNIKEGEDGFEVEMAAPGLTKKDFKVELVNDQLTISSEKEIEKKSQEEGIYTKREFSYQSFCRTFNLPNSADAENIKANYDNGLLRVYIPKKEEAKPKPPKSIMIS
jgi:HSP20 family protein